jgi:DNA-binding MarR family transcriptional regulator
MSNEFPGGQMTSESPGLTAIQLAQLDRQPMIRLLGIGVDAFRNELNERLGVSEFGDIRPGHSCVFGTIDPVNGSRLTDLAERAGMTKQTVGEMVSDLEERGYLERVPDPGDRRAKVISLTERGVRAYLYGRGLIDELEREWAERYGEERIAALRDALEAVVGDRSGVPA